jgi:hypothetical protein
MSKYKIFVTFLFVSFMFQNVAAQWKPTQLGMKSVQSFIRDNTGNFIVSVLPETNLSIVNILFSSDYGFTWDARMHGLRDSVIFGTLETDGDHLYTNTIDGLFISTDKGLNWLKCNTYDPNFIQRVDLIACKDSNIVIGQCYFHDNNSLLSTDRGKTWRDLHTGGWTFDNINDIIIQDTVIWFRGTGTYQLERQVPGNNYISFRLDTIVHESLVNMAVMNRYIFLSSYLSVYRSSDDGDHWIKVFGDIQRDTIHALTVIGNDIFLGGKGVAYVSRDYGQTWRSIGDGLPSFWIGDFIVANNALYASLFEGFNASHIGPLGGGVWYRLLVDIGLGTDEEDKYLPISLALDQNYPNPCTNKTIIKYSMGVTHIVTITVHDILERLVKTLVKEIKSPGQYETSFSTDGLPNGMYIYSLEAGGVRLTRKMVLYR